MHEDAFRQSLRQRLDGVRFPEESRLQVLTQIKGEPKVKKKLSLGLILAFALILITLTVLAATQTGLLQYLVGSPEKASKELIDIVQPLDVEVIQDNIRIKLTGVTYDGEKLALSWITENTQPKSPATLSIQSASANGQNVYPNFSDLQESWRPVLFSMQEAGFDRNVVTGGMIGLVEGDKLSGQVDMVLSIAVSRPTGPLVVVDESLYQADENEPSRVYRLETLSVLKASGLTIATENQLDPIDWLNKGYTPVDSGGEVLEENIEMTSDGTQRIYQKAMKQSAVIKLSFTFNADQGLNQVRYLAKEGTEIKLEDCTLHINRLSISPLTTRFSLDLVPHDNSSESALVLQERYGNISPTSGGKNLDFAEMEFESSGGRRQLPDGRWAYHLDMLFPGLNTYPDTITLSPRWNYFVDRREGDISQEDMRLIEAFEKELVFKVK